MTDGSLLLIAIAIVVLAEAPTWRGYRARLSPSAHDRSSARWVTIAGVLGAVVALALRPWANDVPVLRLPDVASPIGALLAAAGAGLRHWSIRELGRAFTLTLQATAEQSVVETGPYRFIRHPGYLGGDIALLGVGVTCGNWVSTLAMVAPMAAAHLWRIPLEEQMLEQVIGDRWRQYARKTARLVPRVF